MWQPRKVDLYEVNQQQDGNINVDERRRKKSKKLILNLYETLKKSCSGDGLIRATAILLQLTYITMV